MFISISGLGDGFRNHLHPWGSLLSQPFSLQLTVWPVIMSLLLKFTRGCVVPPWFPSTMSTPMGSLLLPSLRSLLETMATACLGGVPHQQEHNTN